MKDFFHCDDLRLVVAANLPQFGRNRRQPAAQVNRRPGANHTRGDELMAAAIGRDHSIAGTFRPAVHAKDSHFGSRRACAG